MSCKHHRPLLAAVMLVALLLAPTAAGSYGGRIVNGTQASPGEYPAHGALLINLDADPAYEGLCGGTLLGRQHFLTAAHCVDGEPPTDLLVYVGDVDINGTAGAELLVASVDMHPGWNPFAYQNDLAMLTLANVSPFQPMRVIRPHETALTAPGTQTTIIGWGTTQQGGGGPASQFLLEANVPIITDALCASQYAGHVPAFDPNTMICAYDGVHDTCQGDSGGPLLVPNPAGGFVLAGVTSWGEGCANADFAGVYARLGGPLNEWVMQRHPWSGFGVGPAHSGAQTELTATAFHPTAPFTSFTWDFDNDGQYNDAGGATIGRVFPSGGAFPVGVRAVNPAGDVADYRQIVVVNGTPTAEAGGPYRVAEGSSLTLAGSGTDPEGQALTFGWDLNDDNTFETNGANPRFAARVDGPFAVGVGVRACDSAGGCATDSATVAVVNVRPRVNGGRDRRARRGRRVRFRIRITDPGPGERFRIAWTCGNRRRGAGRTVACRYRRVGRFAIRIRVRDDDGGVGTDTVRVRVRR